MLGRVGALAYRSGRHENIRRAAFSVSALTVTGLVAYNQPITKAEALYSSSQDAAKLVVPTLEASSRAWRLFRTAFLVVLDYERAKLDDVNWSLGFLCQKKASLDEDHGVREERRYWEDEVERRREELERAQIAYTSEIVEQHEGVKMTAASRKMTKRNQKKSVHISAERLAEAQDRLAEFGDKKSTVHRKAANRLMHLCRDNGGVYIKIGQHLANLDYLIPQEYIDVLSSLFDDAPLTDYSDVREVIKEELGKYPEDIFESFEQEPIASASLAQVHRAVDKETGKKLAVKVQHRGLRETSAGDLFAVTAAVRTLESFFKDFTWGWIADEIAPQLPIELDFCNEGRNSERAAEHIKKIGVDCVIPKVLWGQTSPRVLCMEFEEGFKATDVEAMKRAGLQRHDVAKLISSVFSAQSFLSGFVHCDPHPANVLIREKNGKPEMVLVDHGLYKQIDDDFRIRYANLWRSLMMADLEGIKESCKSIGVDEMYTLFAAMLTSRPFDEIIERSKTGALDVGARPDSVADKAMIQGYAQRFLQDIFEILGTLPRQMLLLLKMNDCLRHIDYALGSPTNTMVVAGNYAARAIYENQLALRNGSFRDRFRSWLDYMKVVVRIRIYDLGLWWANKVT